MPRKRSTSEYLADLEQLQTALEARSEKDGVAESIVSTSSSRSTERRSTKSRKSEREKAKTSASVPSQFEADEIVTSASLRISRGFSSEMTTQEGLAADQDMLSSGVSIQEKIALQAYYHWEARNRQHGSPDDDWYRAEKEILTQIIAAQ